MNVHAYHSIVRHYEGCLERHGDSHLGVDWPNAEDADLRHRIMLQVIRPGPPRRVSLLDFGCGTAALYNHILLNKLNFIDYTGLDISDKFINISSRKFPSVPFLCLDILRDSDRLSHFDYVVMNGVFTEKLDLSYSTMFEYMEAVLCKVLAKTKIGLAFNVMQECADRRRNDLFHVSCDRLTALLVRRLSRHFILRYDYGLYEYTAYVYKTPTRS